MENSIQIFSNEEFGEIRTLVIEGAPWFVGKDLASALGYKDTDKAIRDHVAADDKRIFKPADLAGLRSDATFAINSPRGCVFVNESGMYALIFGSKLERAKEFKHWVTSVVLPDIRKTGSYVGAAITPALLRRLADELERSQVTAAKPALLEGGLTRTWTVTAIASEYDMSAQWLNRTLWELGIQRRSGSTWRLTMSALREMRRRGEEWIIIAQYERELADGSIKYGAPYMRWTDAGRRYIHEMLTAQGIERKWVE